jgi:hypothetical protein
LAQAPLLVASLGHQQLLGVGQVEVEQHLGQDLDDLGAEGDLLRLRCLEARVPRAAGER